LIHNISNCDQDLKFYSIDQFTKHLRDDHVCQFREWIFILANDCTRHGKGTWDSWQEVIEKEYLEGGMPLDQLVAHMEEKYGFSASSVRAYH
jgi:Clr5 domain